MSDDLPLVPGRECGDCTICCRALTIDTVQMQKVSGSTCRHCVEAGGTGCSIYAARPPVCQVFHCGWRRFDFLDESWRPDLSDVFVELEMVGSDTGLSLMLLGDPIQTVRQKWFVDFITVGILHDSPLVLALPGPRGHKGARLMLNTPQMKAAVQQTRALTQQLLEMAVAELKACPFKVWTFVHHGNDVST